jgi:hypothetical protein
MQTVEQVISDLSRFSPNARVSPEVDVQGVSPAVECKIIDTENEDLLSRIEELEDTISDSEAFEVKQKELWEKIEDAALNYESDGAALASDILKIHTEYKNLC